MRRHDRLELKCDSVAPAYLHGLQTAITRHSQDWLKMMTMIMIMIIMIMMCQQLCWHFLYTAFVQCSTKLHCINCQLQWQWVIACVVDTVFVHHISTTQNLSCIICYKMTDVNNDIVLCSKVCRNINRIKTCMENGRTVVLLNLENLYESLYDALNQVRSL